MQKYGVKFLQGEKNDISLRALFEIRKKYLRLLRDYRSQEGGFSSYTRN